MGRALPKRVVGWSGGLHAQESSTIIRILFSPKQSHKHHQLHWWSQETLISELEHQVCKAKQSTQEKIKDRSSSKLFMAWTQGKISFWPKHQKSRWHDHIGVPHVVAPRSIPAPPFSDQRCVPQNAPNPNLTNLHKLTNTACPRKRKCRSRFPSFCPLRFLAFIASSYAWLFQLLQASLVAPSLSQSDWPKLRKEATNNSKGWPPMWGCKNQSSRARKRELLSTCFSPGRLSSWELQRSNKH